MSASTRPVMTTKVDWFDKIKAMMIAVKISVSENVLKDTDNLFIDDSPHRSASIDNRIFL
jgi:hypothetical protein